MSKIIKRIGHCCFMLIAIVVVVICIVALVIDWLWPRDVFGGKKNKDGWHS